MAAIRPKFRCERPRFANSRLCCSFQEGFITFHAPDLHLRHAEFGRKSCTTDQGKLRTANVSAQRTPVSGAREQGTPLTGRAALTCRELVRYIFSTGPGMRDRWLARASRLTSM